MKSYCANCTSRLDSYLCVVCGWKNNDFIKFLYEILVPTMMVNIHGNTVPVRTKHHRVWDGRVRKVSGGLTILKPAKGQWISPNGTLFDERMIPVRIYCTESEIEKISDITAKHYNQEAVMYYRVSDTVVIKHYK